MSYSSTNDRNMLDGRRSTERTIIWRLVAAAAVGIALIAVNVAFWP